MLRFHFRLNLLLLTLAVSAAQAGHLQVRFPEMDRPLLEGWQLDWVPPLQPLQPEAIITAAAYERLLNAGLHPEVVHRDVEAFYASRLDPERDMGGFFTYAETRDQLDQLHALNPEISTERFSIGQSLEGREIWAMKISDHPQWDEDEPEVLLDGLHHAREPITIHVLLNTMEYLLTNYGSDPQVTWLVDNRELFFVPIVNPDGYEYNRQTNPDGGGMWRKTRRNNGDGSFGVDPNRNYGWHWGYDDDGSSPTPSSETYRGPYAFSEPCVQALRQFMMAHQIRVADHYHSYSNLLLIPYGYNGQYTPAPDDAKYWLLTDSLRAFNGYTPGNAGELLYPVNGDAVDYSYGEQTEKNKIFALTTEVGGYNDGFWPPSSRIEPLCAENLGPNLYLFKAAGAYYKIQNPVFSELSGDGDDLWEPGEVLTLTFAAVNGGIFDISGGEVHLSTDSPWLTISPDLRELEETPWGETTELPAPFAINIAPEAPEAFPVVLQVEFRGNGLTAGLEELPLMIGQPAVLFSDDFSTDQGWSGYGGPAEWMRAAAAGGSGHDTHGGGDPQTDHSPGDDNFCLGNDLTATDGDYEPQITSTQWIVSPEIDCGDYTHVTLEFQRWLGVERNLYDHAYLEGFDGENWHTIWENDAVTLDENTWNDFQYDVSALADGNPAFRIRFGLGPTDSGWEYCGWNIDDLEVRGFPAAGTLPAVTDLQISYQCGTVLLSWNYSQPVDHFEIQTAEHPLVSFSSWIPHRKPPFPHPPWGIKASSG